MTYIDTCRRRIAALDGTELTPAERGELRAIAGSRHLRAQAPDVAAAAAALIDPPPQAVAAGFKRGQRRAGEMVAAATTGYPFQQQEN